jgi:PRTRC genetic system protein F
MNSNYRLPVFASGVPRSIVPSSGRQRAARLARCLLDAGLIQGRVHALRAANPLGTSAHHLQRWLRERLGPLKCLHPEFRMSVCERTGFPGDTGAEAEEHAYFVWFAHARGFVVGEALDRLEAMLPGLGATVLRAIEQASFRLIPVFTPSEALGIARDYLWYGEDDERLALDERCADDEAERETIRQELVTREKLDGAFPAWALGSGSRRRGVGRRTLQRVALTACSARVRRVADDALALLRLDLDDRLLPECEGAFVGYGALLMWHEGDIAARIFDDYMNDAMQGDAYDAIGEASFGLDDAQAAREWMDTMEPRFEGMRRLDGLIHGLSTGDWRRIQKGFQ